MEPQDHIPTEVLLDYVEARLDEETAAPVRAHLDTGCARCTGERAFWTRLLAALRRARPNALPEKAVEQAILIFDRRTDSRAAPRPPQWERIAAAVARPVLASGAAPFQLLFRAEATDIDLLCERKEGGWRITGQALSQDTPEAGWTVAATGAAGCAATETDARGEFRLPRLVPGVYQLILLGASRRILLRDVRLAASLS